MGGMKVGSPRVAVTTTYNSTGRSFSMAKIQRVLRSFMAEEEGAALAEYAILIAFIAIVCIVAVTFLGSKISAKFAGLGNSFT